MNVCSWNEHLMRFCVRQKMGWRTASFSQGDTEWETLGAKHPMIEMRF